MQRLAVGPHLNYLAVIDETSIAFKKVECVKKGDEVHYAVKDKSKSIIMKNASVKFGHQNMFICWNSDTLILANVSHLKLYKIFVLTPLFHFFTAAAILENKVIYSSSSFLAAIDFTTVPDYKVTREPYTIFHYKPELIAGVNKIIANNDNTIYIMTRIRMFCLKKTSNTEIMYRIDYDTFRPIYYLPIYENLEGLISNSIFLMSRDNLFNRIGDLYFDSVGNYCILNNNASLKPDFIQKDYLITTEYLLSCLYNYFPNSDSESNYIELKFKYISNSKRKVAWIVNTKQILFSSIEPLAERDGVSLGCMIAWFNINQKLKVYKFSQDGIEKKLSNKLKVPLQSISWKHKKIICVASDQTISTFDVK